MSFNAILTRVLVYHPNSFLAEAVCRELEVRGPFTTMKGCCSEPEQAASVFRPSIAVLDPGDIPAAPAELLLTQDPAGCPQL